MRVTKTEIFHFHCNVVISQLRLMLAFYVVDCELMNIGAVRCINGLTIRASKYTKNAFAAGALHRTLLGELTALPQTPIAGFGGGRGKGGEEEMRGREAKRK